MAHSQLPGTWEKNYICDTCTNPILLVSDGPCVMAVTEVKSGRKFYYTTFTSIDSGRTWDVREWNTEYATPNPSLFHGNNLFSSRTTDDRRGTRPTCIIAAGSIFTTFNIGLNWDYADYRPNLALRMFEPRSGIGASYSWVGSDTRVSGNIVADTGHTRIPLFGFVVPGNAERADGLISDRETMLFAFKTKDSMIMVRSNDQGKLWRYMEWSPSHGILLPLAQGYLVDRVFAVRRGGTNDLIASTTGGATWDTMGPNTGRAMNLYEPGPNRLWMMTARDTVDPIPNPWYIRQTTLCDTFYFSSDNGVSWSRDETFASDTICMMTWSTPDLGYVLGKRDGRTYVARFKPDAKSGVSSTDGNEALFSISPNPFTDHLSISTTQGGEVDVHLHDALGRLRQTQRLFVNGSTRLDLPMTLAPGVYVLSITDAKGRSTSFRVVSQL